MLQGAKRDGVAKEETVCEGDQSQSKMSLNGESTHQPYVIMTYTSFSKMK